MYTWQLLFERGSSSERIIIEANEIEFSGDIVLLLSMNQECDPMKYGKPYESGKGAETH